MRTRQVMATALAVAMAVTTAPVAVFGQQNATLGGTAKNEAKKPFTDYSVRARNPQAGQIAGMEKLDNLGNFKLADLPAASYVVELLDRNNKVVCTEGPFDMTKQSVKNDVSIDCNSVPAAWWLLGAAAAAGVTAGVVAANASAAQ